MLGNTIIMNMHTTLHYNKYLLFIYLPNYNNKNTIDQDTYLN